MPEELNCGGVAVSKGIIVRAMDMAGLVPQAPNWNPEEWEWRVSQSQRAMLLFIGMAQTFLLRLKDEITPEISKLLDRPSPWFVFLIPLEADRGLRADTIELWHHSQHILSITNLALPPNTNEEPNAETNTVR